MILLEQYIEISVYHESKLQRFNVMEVLTDDGELSFKVLQNSEYFFTLTGKTDSNLFRLELSERDRQLDIDIDWNLLSKIKVSLYSIFLNEQPS